MPPDKTDPESKAVKPFRLIPGRNDEKEVLETIVSGSIAQIVLAVAAVLAICYAGKVPLITLLLSILVAFILAPIADWFERWHAPRWASSFIAVCLLLAALYGIAYVSYSKAMQFVEQLPQYSQRMSRMTLNFRRRAEKIQETTEAVLPTSPTPGSKAVTVKQQPDIGSWINSGLTEVILSIAFIPFLTYFMLTWRERARDKTVKLFDPDHRHKVHVTLGGIAEMIKAFLIGNLVCGLFMSVISAAAFGVLRLPYFYFLGFISGFLSLIPYLGVVLAMAPPIVAGIDQLTGTSVLVIALHVFAINVLFPKLIGKRLNLNPLVVTVALLIWGWIWGAVGLILALPITGALKIIFDHIEALRPVGAWMEE